MQFQEGDINNQSISLLQLDAALILLSQLRVLILEVPVLSVEAHGE